MLEGVDLADDVVHLRRVELNDEPLQQGLGALGLRLGEDGGKFLLHQLRLRALAVGDDVDIGVGRHQLQKVGEGEGGVPPVERGGAELRKGGDAGLVDARLHPCRPVMAEDKVPVGGLNKVALEHPVALAVVVQKGLQGGDADVLVHGAHRVGH